MNQLHLNFIRRIFPKLTVVFFVGLFSTASLAQEKSTNGDELKKMKKTESKLVNAPSEIALDQVTGRILKVQSMLSELGQTKPTEKLLVVLPTLCPDIPLSKTDWPDSDLIRKSVASHFDQGQLYLEMLQSTLEEIQGLK